MDNNNRQEMSDNGNNAKKKNNMLYICLGVILIGLIIAAIIIFRPKSEPQPLPADDEMVTTLDTLADEEVAPEVMEEPETPSPAQAVNEPSKKTSAPAAEPAAPQRLQNSPKPSASAPESSTPNVSVKDQAPQNAATQRANSRTEAPKTNTGTETNASVATSNVHDLGYATWKGGWKAGKPHGSGTMTYKQAYRIDFRDSEGRTAQPGEYVTGEWNNGKLVKGTWVKSNGSKEAIIIKGNR